MAPTGVVESLRDAAAQFVRTCLIDPLKCGLSRSENLWMEELSKIYLTADLDIAVPEHPTEEFSAAIKKATGFGGDNAIMTRIVLSAINLVSEKDFRTNTSSFLTTLEHHKEEWNRKFIEAQHNYTPKRTTEDFMRAYFTNPGTISQSELTYYLTLYFRHFYRLFYQFMLFYTQSGSLTYYGRAVP